ncbi:helix-turn-helix transcriptional regulator [Cellulomonas sp. McL0617]|uniref:helix-turn-helix transcriptional regulator n=1 Tax=Cellulomonas sp. McL0617 TaxID=3415675 RepID=UPI003CF00A91
MRADRLVATLLLMQARGRVTAAEIASALEVSLATARRDLEALSTAGIPVYPQPGRGGGWSLVGGARTDLTGLTSSEAQALFLLVGPTSGRSASAVSALRKLVRALPETFRADAEAAAQAVVVDRGPWGAAAAGSDAVPAVVDELQTAVVRRRQVSLVYRSSPEPRVVDPWALVDKDGTWYLVAGTSHGRRTFRVDRIVSVDVLESAFSRPQALDVEAVWASVVGELEERRSVVSAEVLAPAWLVPVLQRQFGRHCEVLGPDDDRVRLRVAAHLARAVAEQLAGHGSSIEVVSPPEVVAELVRIGRELTQAYVGGAR